MTKFINDDFVRLYKSPDSKSSKILTLVFGDEVKILGNSGDFIKLQALTHFDGMTEGWAKNKPKLKFRDTGILKFSMVDVQQGDGMVLESPSGKIVLIDGGDNKLFARHLAARFRHRQSSEKNPLHIDAIIITHGDADHFKGLNHIYRSETKSGILERKRLFIYPERVFHNGLVKRPSKRENGSRRKDTEMFGRTVENGSEIFIVDLEDDPRCLGENELNRPFKSWVKSLRHWGKCDPIKIRRVAFGDKESKIFDFLNEDAVTVKIQGPFVERQKDPDDGQIKPALRFLRKPSKSPDMHLCEQQGGSHSASHTINGHSIALQVQFGNVRMNLTGDLNKPSMNLMRQKIGEVGMEAEIVKAPHHGSFDFDFKTLKAMSPVVAIISSGDESASKEHIHPRATLMAALGKVMRLNTGIIFSTELAAFFAKREYSHKREDLKKFFAEHEEKCFTGKQLKAMFTGRPDSFGPKDSFFAFERTNFGIIHIRTDGERVLVFTHSGKKGLNEAYRFTVKPGDGDCGRRIKFAQKVKVR